jgi:hypothetical protein
MEPVQGMTPDQEPQLAAPGAGLPAPELFIARRIFALKHWLGSRQSFSDEFARGRLAVAAAVASCPARRRGERVLIPRLRGLEDSSRFWSVWMTLDHLRITNLAFARIITSLGSGSVPEGRASTADVKPDPAVAEEVEAAYEASCDAVRDAVASVPDLRTAVRFEHPWFGPLDASGWQALAAMHLGIHRTQIARIAGSFLR